MRTQLYKLIKTTINNNMPEIKHVDVWNHNVEFIEQEDTWQTPAVFVELNDIEWKAFVGGGYRGQCMAKIHIVTSYLPEGHAQAWQISEGVFNCIDSIAGEGVDRVTLISSQTNHNHEDILETTDIYSIKGIKAKSKITP